MLSLNQHFWTLSEVNNFVSHHIQGVISAVLTKCSRDQGFIPVNKNLW